MLVGHLGAGLAAKAVAPRVGLGTLVAAAFLLDILLWLFVTLHIEGVVVPGDFGREPGMLGLGLPFGEIVDGDFCGIFRSHFASDNDAARQTLPRPGPRCLAAGLRVA